MVKERKKSWSDKVEMARNCYLRAKNHDYFAKLFYKNLFFLNPDIEKLFKETDFDHQRKALMNGLDFLFDYFEEDEWAKSQVARLARTHNVEGLNIHPHLYYYWVEALVMTTKETDKDWHDDLEYYLREIISYPISFFISQYFVKS